MVPPPPSPNVQKKKKNSPYKKEQRWRKNSTNSDSYIYVQFKAVYGQMIFVTTHSSIHYD